MGGLTVSFHGVCTHFMGVVPGIPHRVVLPDASAFQFGLLELPSHPAAPLSYFLSPHVAVLRTNDADQERLEVPGSMSRGNVFDGIRIEVANAIDPAVVLEDFRLPSLGDFVVDYAYSDEVVLGGRAVCYFDILGGRLTTQERADGELHAVAHFETDGPPELLVTPFFTSQTSHGEPRRIRLEGEPSPHLIVANVGTDCNDPDQQFDFLLHYLTGKGGVPRMLLEKAPGMVDPQPIRQEKLDAALVRLSQFDFPRRFELLDEEALRRKARGLTDTSPACSNSGYP